MGLWLARDESGSLWVYENKPRIMGSNCVYDAASTDEVFFKLDERLYPEVTYENSPVELVPLSIVVAILQRQVLNIKSIRNMTKEQLSEQYADKKTSESPRNAYRLLPIEKQKELTCFDGYEIEVAYEDGFDKAVEEIRKEIERRILAIENREYQIPADKVSVIQLRAVLSFIDSLQKGTKCI